MRWTAQWRKKDQLSFSLLYPSRLQIILIRFETAFNPWRFHFVILTKSVTHLPWYCKTAFLSLLPVRKNEKEKDFPASRCVASKLILKQFCRSYRFQFLFLATFQKENRKETYKENQSLVSTFSLPKEREKITKSAISTQVRLGTMENFVPGTEKNLVSPLFQHKKRRDHHQFFVSSRILVKWQRFYGRRGRCQYTWRFVCAQKSD